MSVVGDPFEVILVDNSAGGPAVPVAGPRLLVGAVTARFHGFDLNDRVIVGGVPGLPDELLLARSTVPLTHAQKGSTVVVLCEDGNPRLPIVVGVLEESHQGGRGQPGNPVNSEHRLVLTAEREVVLRCGEASITLTRAGKVIIQGSYIVSRSTGYNKIKGAAIDIN